MKTRLTVLVAIVLVLIATGVGVPPSKPEHRLGIILAYPENTPIEERAGHPMPFSFDNHSLADQEVSGVDEFGRGDACRTYPLAGWQGGINRIEGLACDVGVVATPTLRERVEIIITTIVETLTPNPEPPTSTPPSPPTNTPPSPPTETAEPPDPTETIEPPDPTKTPRPPVIKTPRPKANCGVGQGEPDGDTPGCDEWENDGEGSGPGDPGHRGGKDKEHGKDTGKGQR